MTAFEATRIGVLLANTGTPKSPEPRDVRRYLGRFLMDERIRPMAKAPWWLILHLFILPTRSVKSGRKYGKIWTEAGSPFDVEHAKLRNLLEQLLQGDGMDVRVQVGQSYGEDSVQDALAALREQGCTQVVVLPLYPQSAHSTTLSVKDGVAAAMTELSWQAPVTFVDSYGMDSAYIDAIAETVSAAGFNAQAGDRLLFNYHSIPMKDIEQGDTYEPQTGATALGVAGRLRLDRTQWTIGYNCRFDKSREWLQPFTRGVLKQWAQARDGRVFMVCPNFAVDCLETLYDIEYELVPWYRQAVEEAGRPYEGSEFVYVPCLNGTPMHASVLAHVLAPYLTGEDHHE